MSTINITDKKWYILSPLGLSLIPLKGNILFCAEQYLRYFQSKSQEYREEIINCASVKQLLFISGKKYMEDKLYEIDPKFEGKRYKLMEKAYSLKIKHNPLVRALLQNTDKDKFIYENRYDLYFGTFNDKGENKLNDILKYVRET